MKQWRILRIIQEGMGMRKTRTTVDDWRNVLPVPPLARRRDAGRTLDFAANTTLAGHLRAGGMRHLLYGGNAFLYHLPLAEFGELLGWLAQLPDDVLAIPSLGPSYGRARDQAPLVRKHAFPLVMMLPCNDPRDARGLEQGYREIASEAEAPLMLYLKDEDSFGADREAGLDAVARLVSDGVCQVIKYAVVRENPAQDLYLDSLLSRVDRRLVISGIGERPAIVHLRDFGLPGFTSGSACLAPRLSAAVLRAAAAGRWDEAEQFRAAFLPLEDLRDAWGAARVLHAAIELAGIAGTGPVPPYASELAESQREQVQRIALALAEAGRAGDVSR
jgi:dihydrodipicolinate synthase/N-acetylneuraminate lyase